MKSDRHQGNALTGASIKITNTRYNKCKNPDKSDLLTRDLKVAIDCTVSGVIFSEFQGAMTRSQKKCLRTFPVHIQGNSISSQYQICEIQ